MNAVVIELIGMPVALATAVWLMGAKSLVFKTYLRCLNNLAAFLGNCVAKTDPGVAPENIFLLS
ncbi:MAG: hypothetical protein PHF15_11680 [Rhodoferax sp.]|nr:hypothetical protein [Rhodoferax sp.]